MKTRIMYVECKAAGLTGPARIPIEIDDDVREEYWTEIRGEPENCHRRRA